VSRMVIMARTRRIYMWMGRITVMAIIARAFAHLGTVGPDRADKPGSALSLVVAIVTLLVPLRTPDRRSTVVCHPLLPGHRQQTRP
jgi:hypothetical protein